MSRFATIVLACAFGALNFVAPVPSRADTATAAAPVDVQSALREAALEAVTRATAQLAQPGGFFRTPEFHIPLPDSLDDQVSALGKVYATELPIALDRTVNRAAEATAKPAGDFLAAQMPALTFAKPEAVTRGPPDAITTAIRAQFEAPLRAAIRPVIQANLAATDATGALKRMQARYERATNTSFPKFDLTDYALGGFVDMYFAAVAKKELEIRTRPSSRSAASVQALFAN